MKAAAARKPTFAPDPARRGALAKVHLAKKEMGLAEDDYRALLMRVAGKGSAGDMVLAELDSVIREMKRLGWQQAPARHGAARKAADHPAARKARSLWISLWQLGVVRSPSEQALEAFARRQLKCDRLQWADQAQCFRLIEALKAMAERAGWRQSGYRHNATEHDIVVELVRVLHARLLAVDAQAPSLEQMDEAWAMHPMAGLYAIARDLADRRRAAEAAAA